MEDIEVANLENHGLHNKNWKYVLFEPSCIPQKSSSVKYKEFYLNKNLAACGRLITFSSSIFDIPSHFKFSTIPQDSITSSFSPISMDLPSGSSLKLSLYLKKYVSRT